MFIGCLDIKQRIEWVSLACGRVHVGVEVCGRSGVSAHLKMYIRHSAGGECGVDYLFDCPTKGTIMFTNFLKS